MLDVGYMVFFFFLHKNLAQKCSCTTKYKNLSSWRGPEAYVVEKVANV